MRTNIFPWSAKFALILIFCLAVTVGCRNEAEKKEAVKAFEINKEYRRGPVTFSVSVSQKEITVADQLRLKLEIRAKETYEVELPQFGEKLEQFGIVDYTSLPPVLVEKGLISYVKTYELEPFLSGEYKIPPMEVRFWKKGEEKKHTVSNEELSVTVKSGLPENTDLTLKEIVPPVELPYEVSGWVYGSLGFLVLGGIGAAGFVRWKKRVIQEVIFRKTPNEIAYEDLEVLLAKDLLEKGETKLFYLRLSNILRHYIENRFGLRAPERTTPEFLVELRSTDVLSSIHKNLLKEFLQHCDMVKFAEHNPTSEEIQKTFDTCKQFVLETEIAEKTVEEAA